MKYWICLIVLLLCVGCTTNPKPSPVTPTPTTNANKPCDALDPCGEEADMSEYETLKEADHRYVNAEYSDLVRMINNKESGIFYIGRPTCPYCVEVVPILNEVAKQYEVNVYYINSRSDYSASDAGLEDKEVVIAFLHDYLMENDDGDKALFVPNVLVMKKGEIIGNHISTVGDYDINERPMNEEEVAELTKIYEDYFAAFVK